MEKYCDASHPQVNLPRWFGIGKMIQQCESIRLSAVWGVLKADQL